MISTDDWSVILLTGGTGRRLNGADKAALDLGGVTLLERALASISDEVPVVICGPEVPIARDVAFRGIAFQRENPPGGGPAAGIAAALDAVTTPLVAVLAVDMPWAGTVLPGLIEALDASPGSDLAVAVDATGRRQLLCSAWRTEALLGAVGRCGDLAGRPVRDLLADAAVLDFPVEGPSLDDIDTPDDLARARQRADRP